MGNNAQIFGYEKSDLEPEAGNSFDPSVFSDQPSVDCAGIGALPACIKYKTAPNTEPETCR